MDIVGRHMSERNVLALHKQSKPSRKFRRNLNADENPDRLGTGCWPCVHSGALGARDAVRIGHCLSNAAITSATIRSSWPS